VVKNRGARRKRKEIQRWLKLWDFGGQIGGGRGWLPAAAAPWGEETI
jgi:hypothetical protein